MNLHQNANLLTRGVAKDNNTYNHAAFKSIFVLSIPTLEDRGIRTPRLLFLLALSRDIYTAELSDCYLLWQEQ
jgi:hypothetical protein